MPLPGYCSVSNSTQLNPSSPQPSQSAGKAAETSEKTRGKTNLGNMPLHPITNHPPLPQRTPIPLPHRMLILVIHRRIARPVVIPTLPTNHHAALQPPQHGSPHHRRPRIHRLHDLHARAIQRLVRLRMRRAHAVRRRGRAAEVRLQPLVEVVALAEAADEHDAADDAAGGADAGDLALHEVADLLDDGLEDVLDLRGRHDEEAAVDAGGLVVGQPREGHVDLGVLLVLVEVALDELLEVL